MSRHLLLIHAYTSFNSTSYIYSTGKTFTFKMFLNMKDPEAVALTFVSQERVKLKLKLLEGNPCCCCLEEEKMKLFKNCTIIVLSKKWSHPKILSNQNRITGTNRISCEISLSTLLVSSNAVENWGCRFMGIIHERQSILSKDKSSIKCPF